eukprot:TRINITY_DN7110_c0_g1_i1.p1 TRINITY_DN7110_c0_g1~~TRINITY_DN7110_c0_g1_i1.p1  ORF type:complete len:205 (+),score=11.56 TRINITY_DN7110_c0_g1_i1:28-615(+)
MEKDLSYPLDIVWAQLDSGIYWPSIVGNSAPKHAPKHFVRILHRQPKWLLVDSVVSFDAACVRNLQFKDDELNKAVELGLFLLKSGPEGTFRYLSKEEISLADRKTPTRETNPSVHISPCLPRKGLLSYLDSIPNISMTTRRRESSRLLEDDKNCISYAYFRPSTLIAATALLITSILVSIQSDIILSKLSTAFF